ncbi:MAG: RecX family transcriptional regulator [Oscillospiraceae bacterium]|nr:RecX family transcriptional regulator [Oscillospiraceae bacterium]
MMRIESLSAQPDRAGRYRTVFSDGSTLRLYRQTVEDFGLYTGMEMDDETFSRLQVAAGQMSAKMRAVRIVAASSVSQKDLEQRLIHKGEDPKQAKEAVQWLESLDLIDDRKTAEQIIARCIAKGYGLARAKQALYEKRIPKEYWQEALADYPDQLEAIVAFLGSRLTGESDDRQVKKAIDALLRRGHSYAQIRKGLQKLSLNEDFSED